MSRIGNLELHSAGCEFADVGCRDEPLAVRANLQSKIIGCDQQYVRRVGD